MIDGCVARLRKYKPEEYELIIAHFVVGVSLRSIAKKENVVMELFARNFKWLWDLLMVV